MEFLRSKNAVNIGLVVVILVIIVGIYYSLAGNGTSVEDEGVVESEDPKTTEIVDENYSIYRNYDYGYSFEFPTTWTLYDEFTDNVLVEFGGEGSKYVLIHAPYADDILEGELFLDWAESQEWPFAPTAPRDYFEEIKISSGLVTYKRATTTEIQTVIVPIESNLIYISRVDGTGEGNIEGEDIYFHLLNTFEAIDF